MTNQAESSSRAADVGSQQQHQQHKLAHKRSTLFYPNRAPASLNAAKRESVQALGSIEHLQRLFAREGLAKASRPDVLGLSATPALGGGLAGAQQSQSQPRDAALAALEGRSSLLQEAEDEAISNTAPPQSTYKHRRFKWQDVSTTEAHHDALRPGVVTALDEICSLWNLQARTSANDNDDEASSISSHGSSAEAPVDVVRLLSATAALVASVRQYLIALPSHHVEAAEAASGSVIHFHASRSSSAAASMTSTGSSTSSTASRDAFKRQSSFLGLPRGAGSAAGLQAARSASMTRKASEEASPASSSPVKQQQQQQRAAYASLGRADASTASHNTDDPLVRVRRAALRVLGSLRVLDEKVRLVAVEDANAFSSASSTSGASEASLGTSPDDAASSRRGSFDAGHLYRSDVKISELAEEQQAVQDYVAIVDGVLAAHAPLRRLSRTAAASSRRRDASASPVKQRSVTRVTATADAADGSPRMLGGGLPAFMLNAGESEVDEPSELDGDQDVSPQAAEASLPAWARKGAFQGRELVRAYTLLAEHLPIVLAEELPLPPSSPSSSSDSVSPWRQELLSTLSDGQLLVIAYNTTLRRSRRPWGFIEASMIHDLRSQPLKLSSSNVNGGRAMQASVGAEASPAPTDQSHKISRPGWTFRRTENLRAWAAALRLRYGIVPGKADTVKATLPPRRAASESSSSTTHQPLQSSPASNVVQFDAPTIALKGPGWETSLESMLLRWVEAVVEEERSCD